MKKLKVIHAMQAAVVAFALFSLSSCTDTPSSPSQSGSGVVMRTDLDRSIVRPVGSSSENQTRGFGSYVDSLQITHTAFVASNFTLRSDAADNTDDNFSEETIRSEQFLLGFDEGRQYIGEKIVLGGTYLRAKFNLHMLQGKSDSLALAMGPLYTTLFASAAAENTVIIHGFVWKDGFKMPFVYNSQISGSESVLFDRPLVIASGTGQTEVLVYFNTSNAFSTGEGFLMDPRDSRNASGIDINLKHSLKARFNEGS